MTRRGGLLLVLNLALLGSGAEGQGKRQVLGGATFHLGQDRDIWRPLIHTTVNLTEISSIKSTFKLRTYDAEGPVFYGDTKNGKDWFILALKDGVPLMQMCRDDILVNVAGGPKINDGKWHTLEVSNQRTFVVLEVDGAKGLVMGLQYKEMEEVITGALRLALGGLLIDSDKIVVPFDPHMDACVRDGSWLNLSAPWESDVDDLWSCSENIQPGSYFPGSGFAVFNASAFPIEDEDGVKFELWGDYSQIDGTILSIRAPGQKLLFSLVAYNNTKEIILTIGDEKIHLKIEFMRMVITFGIDSMVLHVEEDELSGSDSSIPLNQPGYLTTWREGRVAIGGLLGEGESDVGSHFLRGCLKNFQIQGKDLNLDLADKHMSISAHSCPA